MLLPSPAPGLASRWYGADPLRALVGGMEVASMAPQWTGLARHVSPRCQDDVVSDQRDADLWQDDGNVAPLRLLLGDDHALHL